MEKNNTEKNKVEQIEEWSRTIKAASRTPHPQLQPASLLWDLHVYHFHMNPDTCQFETA